MTCYSVHCKRVWRTDYCQGIVQRADFQGWQAGTYSDGSKRDNVSVCFLKRETNGDLFETISDLAVPLASIVGVDIDDKATCVAQVQVSRWREGDYYSMHSDHDVTLRTLDRARKLSIFVQLSNACGLDVESLGRVHCDTGDLIAFNGLVQHAAPKQEAGERHSLVAWVTGPDYR